MKKSIKIIAILSILINVFLIYTFIIKGETIKTEDNRTTILLNQNNTDFALAEMRGFLESVQKINEGILNNDADLVIDGGTNSGGIVVDHAPKGMMKALPIGFKKLGFSTHDLFDEIAKTAKENFDVKQTQQQLNTLLNNCVACHRTYKITVKE